MQLGTHTDCIQNAYKHIKRVKERILPSTSSLYCLFLYLLLFAIYSQHLLLPAPSGMYGPHQASLPVLLGRVAATFGGHGELPSHAACMHCMHQKRDYARYARTQLRKRLHTMHTETRIGVSVGLRGCKCMQSGMHTDCIQSAYKHIKSRKEKNSFFYFFFIACVPSSFTARIFGHSRTPPRSLPVFFNRAAGPDGPRA